LTGNISSLRLLKDTLEKVIIDDCNRVEGNFMDLTEFPHLKELNLDATAVRGDIRIRDFSDIDFLKLLISQSWNNSPSQAAISINPSLSVLNEQPNHQPHCSLDIEY
jgi:hypothetical protein